MGAAARRSGRATTAARETADWRAPGRRSERVNRPSCDGAMVSGPRRNSAYSASMPAKPKRRVIALVERGDAVDLVDQPQLQMILQIGADARPVEHDRNAVLAQMRGRPDAGQQQDLRRADRAGGEDDFAAAARRCASRRSCRQRTPAARLPSNTMPSARQPVSSRRLARLQHRLEEGARRRPAPAALLVDVKGAEPSLSPVLKSAMDLMPACSAAARNASSRSQRTRGARHAIRRRRRACRSRRGNDLRAA